MDEVHLSIGEVLARLQADFPDVTISKIRFLESQGLVDPKRTPSGYRKFHTDDVDRLRWILHQQREHFLPLKVIKDRLAEIDAEGGALDQPGQVDGPGWGEEAEKPDDVLDLTDDGPLASTPAAPSPASPTASSPSPAPPSPSIGSAGSAAPAPAAGPLDRGPTSLSLGKDELASASGLTTTQLGELVQYGLLEGRQIGGDVVYDGDALVIAQKAAAFIRHGVEPRHLRQYKVSAEREAGLLEQVVMPIAKRRNPAGPREAAQTLAELAELGQTLRAALLRQALDESLAGRH